MSADDDFAPPPPVGPEEQRRRTAHHEAAHAVAGFAIGLGVARASIDPRRCDGKAGCVRFEPEPQTWAGDDDDRRFLAARVYLAGQEAVRRLCEWKPHISESGAAMDEIVAGVLAGRRYDEAKSAAAEFVAAEWPAIERIAAALLERETLDAGEVLEALRS